LWNTAIESCLTDIEINHFHFNEVKNGFNASTIINFNNGVPTDEEKDEIEKQINNKFCGAENASRFLLAFNSNKDNAVTIEKLNTDDYDERYNSLAKKVRQDIFTTFRANPNLFGIATENLGFSSEEYESSFKLFNKTMIQPIQKKMVGALQPLMDIQIKPFTLNNNE
jgi:capsid portal protein